MPSPNAQPLESTHSVATDQNVVVSTPIETPAQAVYIGWWWRRFTLGATIAACFGIAIGVLFWQEPWAERTGQAVHYAFPLPDKLSLAILPFRAGDDGAGLPAIADGITEEVNSVLLAVSRIFVISRASILALGADAANPMESRVHSPPEGEPPGSDRRARFALERGAGLDRAAGQARARTIHGEPSRPGARDRARHPAGQSCLLDRGVVRDDSNWREILDWFEPAYQIGMTATPRREDNVDTYDYFGGPIYEYSLAQGIADGFLPPTASTASSRTTTLRAGGRAKANSTALAEKSLTPSTARRTSSASWR